MPVIAIDGAKVTVLVGEVAHPMTEEHYIQWIVLRPRRSTEVMLTPQDAPRAEFVLQKETKLLQHMSTEYSRIMDCTAIIL